MEEDSSFQDAVDAISVKDGRYDEEAYYFLREVLDRTVREIAEADPSHAPRHVTGRELLEGFRAHALDEFGPLAYTVLRTWGLERTEDVGEMVFNLLECGALSKTEKDSRDDFAGGYDFKEAFLDPYDPFKSQGGRPPPP